MSLSPSTLPSLPPSPLPPTGYSNLSVAWLSPPYPSRGENNPTSQPNWATLLNLLMVNGLRLYSAVPTSGRSKLNNIAQHSPIHSYIYTETAESTTQGDSQLVG